ncbi:hypothetical protein OROHE_018503 [Orobanche hederae]
MSLLMAMLQIVAIIAAATIGNVVVVVQGVKVGDFVTPAFFNGIINQAADYVGIQTLTGQHKLHHY